MLGSIIVALLLAGSAQQAPTQQAAEKPWPPVGVARLGPEVTAPEVVKEEKPKYTPEAMDAKIQGMVVMEAVIERDGTVGEVRVKKSLDRTYGLDDQAVRALKRWRFKPGKKNGVEVPVLVEVEMTFTLRK